VRNHFTAFRQLGVSLLCLTLLLVVAFAVRVEGRDAQQSKPPDPSTAKQKVKPEDPAAKVIEHLITIEREQEDQAKCSCIDALRASQGSRVQRTDAKRGEWIVWENKTGADVTLKFGMSQRLFGVKEAIVYATGEPLKLRIRSDAVFADHPYEPQCDVTQPGPVIIVTPPPTP